MISSHSSSALSPRSLDILGAERIQGNEISFSPHGNTAGCFLHDTEEGVFSANLNFRARSERTFFLRGCNRVQKEIHLNIHVEKDSTIYFLSSLHNSKEGTISLSLDVSLEEEAQFHLLGLSMNEGKENIKITSSMQKQKAISDIFLLNIGLESSKSIISVQNKSETSHTYGNTTMRTILFDDAFCEMKGEPIVAPGAEHCTAHLEQRSLLLSPYARIQSLPMLTIHNSNVEASHTSSLVRLSEEDLFYCQTRGLQRTEAEELFLEGMLLDLLSKVPDKSLRGEMGEKAFSVFQKK